MLPRYIPGQRNRRPCRTGTSRSAFSLVELLTVVGIIALLVGILLPTMSAARTEAKRSATRAFIAACERGLETINTDLGKYPDSNYRTDPITDWPTPADQPNGKFLSGAHWLARAMVGHDGQGLDYSGRSLGSANVNHAKFNAELKKRRGQYVEKAVFADDRSLSVSGDAPGPQTGRIVLLDTFGYPIIYYKANPRAENGFTPGNQNDPRGIYTHRDNFEVTGFSSDPGWDFANNGEGRYHGLGEFGSTNPADFENNIKVPSGSTRKGMSFTGFLHNASIWNQGKTAIKPVKETSFIMIASGPDGIFGTTDDVTNFK